MIKIGNTSIDRVIANNRIINKICKGVITIYEYITSCFGKGFWVNSKEWGNKDGWKNK